MKELNWGIIGCGDVTEYKSGPAFNKINRSNLIAVMRRDAFKAEDYAKRHNVPTWYSDADDLINDERINAIYIATPPSTHKEYTFKVAEAGKLVYVEKPMAIDYNECCEMIEACKRNNVKLFVAYYRRELSAFKKVKQLFVDNVFGKILYSEVRLSLKNKIKKSEELPWRVRSEIAGGGFLFDLASHQIDLLQYYLGEIIDVNGFSTRMNENYLADDTTVASFKFQSGAIGSASWCFVNDNVDEHDEIIIYCENGFVKLSVFNDQPIEINVNGYTELIKKSHPENIQLPLIKTVVNDALGLDKCISTGESASKTNLVLDKITNK